MQLNPTIIPAHPLVNKIPYSIFKHVTVQPSAKLQQMMHRNGKNAVDCGEKFIFHRVATHNSGFSQKTTKTPRGIHHG